MTRKLRMTFLLALCLTASFLTGCPVSKDAPNPDGITSCPPNCRCIESGDEFDVQCDGDGGGGEVMVYQ